MQKHQRMLSEESTLSSAESSVYFTPQEYPHQAKPESVCRVQPPVRRCSLSKKFSQSRNRYSFKTQGSNSSNGNRLDEASTSDDLAPKDDHIPIRRASRQYKQNRRQSLGWVGLRRNSSMEVLTAQRKLMDKALRELYASMQELRQSADIPLYKLPVERSRSLDDSDITDFPAPIKMSTLTPMERVAIKGLASQRRSLRSKSVADKKSVYHSLIPDIFLDDNQMQSNLGANPWTEQKSRSVAMCSDDINTLGEESTMDSTAKEMFIRREQIYESLENILNEIETFSDYKVPPVHLKTELRDDSTQKPSPRMAMDIPPSAMQTLFKTPKESPSDHKWKRRKSSDIMKTRMEVSWEPENEYRSVLTGEIIPVMSPSSTLSVSQHSSTSSKVLRTMCLAYAYFVLGMCVSMIGPSLIDISEIAHITPDTSFQFLTIRGAGVSVGCVLLGSLIRRFDHYVIFGVVLGTCGIANFCFPALDSFAGMVMMEMLIGLCIGFLEAGIQIVIIEIWQERNGIYMLAVHFVYGLGTIIGPLIAEPFLGCLDPVADNMTSVLPEPYISQSAVGNISNLDNFTDTLSTEWPEHYFQYAYFIVGGLFMSCAMCQLCIWWWGGKHRCRYKADQLEDVSALYSNIANKQPALLVLTAVFMFIHVGIEFSYRGLLASYVVRSLGWSRSVGAWITSVTFSTYTLGRGLGFCFSRCLDSCVLLWFNLALIFLSLLAEFLLVEHFPSSIWVTTSIQGIGQSTVLPSCFLWASNKLQVQGITAGILLFIASLGLMVLPGVTGMLMASFKPSAFHIVPLTGVLVNVAIFLAMYVLGKKSDDLLSIVGLQGSGKIDAHMSSTPITRATYIEDEQTVDFNGNFGAAVSSANCEASQATVPGQKTPRFTSLQIHPEFTGSPCSYKVHNDKFTPPLIPEIQLTSPSTVCTKYQSPSTGIQSPYSMNSFTPLAVMSYLHPRSAKKMKR